MAERMTTQPERLETRWVNAKVTVIAEPGMMFPLATIPTPTAREEEFTEREHLFAAELARRWNAEPGLRRALERIVSATKGTVLADLGAIASAALRGEGGA